MRVAGSAPILIAVGAILTANAAKVNWAEQKESFPAFITLFLIPFTYSIFYGVLFGLVVHYIVAVFTGDFFVDSQTVLMSYAPTLYAICTDVYPDGSRVSLITKVRMLLRINWCDCDRIEKVFDDAEVSPLVQQRQTHVSFAHYTNEDVQRRPHPLVKFAQVVKTYFYPNVGEDSDPNVHANAHANDVTANWEDMHGGSGGSNGPVSAAKRQPTFGVEPDALSTPLATYSHMPPPPPPPTLLSSSSPLPSSSSSPPSVVITIQPLVSSHQREVVTSGDGRASTTGGPVQTRARTPSDVEMASPPSNRASHSLHTPEWGSGARNSVADKSIAKDKDEVDSRDKAHHPLHIRGAPSTHSKPLSGVLFPPPGGASDMEEEIEEEEEEEEEIEGGTLNPLRGGGEGLGANSPNSPLHPSHS